MNARFVTLVGTFAILAGCTSMGTQQAYRRSMQDEAAPSRMPAAATQSQASGPTVNYTCVSSDQKTSYTLMLGAESGHIQWGDKKGELFFAQPGEVNAPAGNETLAIDGIDEKEFFYYVTFSKIGQRPEEFPPVSPSSLISIKPGAKDTDKPTQTSIDTTCTKSGT